MNEVEEVKLDILSDTVADVWKALLDNSTPQEMAVWIEAHFDEDDDGLQEFLQAITEAAKRRLS